MPFHSAQEVTTRLANGAEQEVRDLIPWLGLIGEAGRSRLDTELMLQNIKAIQDFDRSSSKLARLLVWLTAALIGLTVVIAD